MPAALSVRYLDDTLNAIRALRPDLPAFAILPGTHRAASYGFVHTGYRPAADAIRQWGARRDVSLLDLAALTREHVFRGDGNPDGMHWGWEGHTEVGKAMAGLITPLLVKAGPGAAT